MNVDCGLSDPKGISPLAPNDVAHHAAAMARTVDDLFNRHMVLGQRQDRRIDLLAPQKSFVLQSLGAGEKLRIDCCCADGGADSPHGFAYGIEECRTGILHEMPTIGNLNGAWQRPGGSLPITTTAVARQDFDLRMIGKPGL